MHTTTLWNYKPRPLGIAPKVKVAHGSFRPKWTGLTCDATCPECGNGLQRTGSDQHNCRLSYLALFVLVRKSALEDNCFAYAGPTFLHKNESLPRDLVCLHKSYVFSFLQYSC